MTPRDFVIWLRGFQKAAHKFNLTPEQWEDLKDQLELVQLEDQPINSYYPGGSTLTVGRTAGEGDSNIRTTITNYTIRSGSSARAGNFMAMWSGSQTDFTDNSINGFGTTTGFVSGEHTTVNQMPPGTNIVYTSKQQLND